MKNFDDLHIGRQRQRQPMKKQSPRSVLLYKPLVLFIVTLLLQILSQTTITLASVGVLDNYCGKDWVNAANACPHHCPSGDDSECIAKLGEGFGCFLFTGCHARVEAGEFGNRDPEEEEEVEVPVEMNRSCGLDFIDAMLTCDDGKKCPTGNECGGKQICVENTNCDKPLVTFKSELVFTFSGTTTLMEDEDWSIFNQVIFDLLQGTTTDLNIHLDSIVLISQRAYEDTTTVEVNVLLEAKYRPPPEQNISTIAENSINLQKETVVENLKKGGNEAKRYYFTTEVKEIGAVSKENATKRPTLSPTGTPTLKGTGIPSMVPSPSPSSFPTGSPSAYPSSTPTRDHIQEISTASTNELKGESDTAHGFLVNMRTTVDSHAILINGFAFYTESTEPVGFEIWSRAGSFEGFEGRYDGWDLVATGTVNGAGFGQFTTVPSDMFTPVSLPGGGGEKGTRAFYLTLNSKNLVIKKMGDFKGITGATDNRVMASSPDLEIYNGKAVLSYPFPDPAQAWLYHSPRVFLGVVTYDRLPCKPFSLYGPVDELPCGVVPTMKPTKKPQTLVPTKGKQDETVIITTAPTLKPTPALSQVVLDTSSPTASFPPTISASPTMSPTASPVAAIKVRIIVTLHNTPDIIMNQEEHDIFIDTLVQFLNDYSGKAMVISGMDIESEEMVMVTASATSLTTSTQSKTGNSATINTTATSKEVARNTLGQRLLKKLPGSMLTVVLKITSTTLPHNLLGNMAVVAVEENQGDLVNQFRKVGLVYRYFENIDRVVSFSADSAGVQFGASSTTSKKPVDYGGDRYVESTNEAPSVNITLLMSLFWGVLAITSIVLLAKARSKLRKDNIENDNFDDPNVDHSDKALRASILRLIPLGSDVDNTAQGRLRRGQSSRSLRQSRTTTGSRSLRQSLRDESFHNDNSLSDSNHRRSGVRSSMRQSLTMSQLLDISSEDDAPVNRGGLRGSGSALRSSMRQSITNSNHDGLKDDAPVNRGGLRRSGSTRSSMRQSITNSNHDNLADDAPVNRGGLRGSGSALRSSMRQSTTNLNHDNLADDAPVNRGGLRGSGSALRSSMRQSITNSNHDSLNDDAPVNRGGLRGSGSALRFSMRQSTTNLNHDNLADDAPVNRGGLRRSGSTRFSMRQSITNSNHDSKGADAEGENSLNNLEKSNNLRGSVLFDDQQLPNRRDNEALRESKVDVDSEASANEGEKESNKKVPERVPRKPSRLSQSMTAKDTMVWGVSEEKKEEPIQQRGDFYKPQRVRRSDNEGSLRRSTARGSAENLADSDGDKGSLRRSGNRGSSDNLRSMAKRNERRSLSQSMSRSSITRRGSDGDTAGLKRSAGARGSSENLRGSTRRVTAANGQGDSTNLRRSSDGSSNNALRGSLRKSASDVNLRGSLRRSASDVNLRGSVRRSSNETNLRGSASSTRAKEQQRAGPRRREIV